MSEDAISLTDCSICVRKCERHGQRYIAIQKYNTCLISESGDMK